MWKRGDGFFASIIFSITRYEYDALNRLISEFDPAGRETKYDYDGNGNLVTTIDRNSVITKFKYDGLNRLLTKQNSKDGNSNVIEYAYDLLGNTRKTANAAGATVFDYDQLGRLLTADYGNGIKKSYDYDQADRITGLQVKQGSVTELDIDYEYHRTHPRLEIYRCSIHCSTNTVIDRPNPYISRFCFFSFHNKESNKRQGFKSRRIYYPL